MEFLRDEMLETKASIEEKGGELRHAVEERDAHRTAAE
jgi:hypothetical protein